MEIKTSVAQSGIGTTVALATVDTITFHVKDQVFKNDIPEEHVAQLFHQIFFCRSSMQFNFRLQRLKLCTKWSLNAEIM